MPHPALVDDFIDELLEQVRAGKTVTAALRGTGLGPNLFYQRLKTNPDLSRRYAEALQTRAGVKADKVDDLMWEVANGETPPSAVLIAVAKRWNPAYRDKLEITPGPEAGSLETASLEELRRMLAEAKGEPQPEIESAEHGAG